MDGLVWCGTLLTGLFQEEEDAFVSCIASLSCPVRFAIFSLVVH